VGEVFVVNASPVITLAKAGHLALLTGLADTIFLPTAVVVEVLAGPESDPARRALEGGWGTRVPVSSMPSVVLEWGLGAVLLQKLVFDAFVENRVSIFQRVTVVKNRTF